MPPATLPRINVSRPRPSNAWHARRIPEVFTALESREAGLTQPEATRRLQATGRNELRTAPAIRPFHLWLRQFDSLLVWILVSAAFLAGTFGDWLDCVAIITIILLNATVGFYQELSAEKSIAALKQLSAPRARVRRDGQVITVPASEIVPGDILELEEGDVVAADARLLEAVSLQCAEAALTGESTPVLKSAGVILEEDLPLADRENLVFTGTTVTRGAGRAAVFATGMNTEIGRIAGLIELAAGESTPLQQRLDAFGRVLVWASLAIVALFFGIGWLRGLPAMNLLLTSVSLAVAAVPEGLPAVLTVALAIGVRRMARRRALVRRLPAVETLGSTSVICTDKTGTLTLGEMTVREMRVAGHTFAVTGEGYGPHGELLLEGQAVEAEHAGPLLELANVLIGCNNARLVLEKGHWEVIGDPTEGAMLAAGHKAGGDPAGLERLFPRHHEIPFDSDRKRRVVLRLLPNGRLRAFVNGAPDLLLHHCTRLYTATGTRPITPADRHRINAENEHMAARGLRVLGSAYRDLDRLEREALTPAEVEHDLVFVGLTGMFDPPRPEAREAVLKCQHAGIRVVMITGDHPRTAFSIARDLGIASTNAEVLAGSEVECMTDEALQRRVHDISVFARVSPEHKLRIVRAWRSHGNVVAMTGDGVNDAPALKGADIGIAMGRTGTEVTKQAADIVVTDDNFASIVAAVEEGRGIYGNIRKTLQYLLATNTGELIFMGLAVLAGLPLPLLPIQLLWINLVTDGLPALMLATGPLDKDLLKQAPRPSSARLLDHRFLLNLVLTGLVTAVVALFAYVVALQTGPEALARSHAFAALVFGQLFCAFAFLSETQPVWRCGRQAVARLGAAVLGTFLLQLLLLHIHPVAQFFKTAVLPWSAGFTLLLLALFPLCVLELAKHAKNSSPAHPHLPRTG